MFTRADKFQDVQRTQDELRDQFPRTQPHPARSFENSSSPMRIGKTVTIKGEVTAAEDMVIYGRLEGTLTVKDHHTLTIGKGAIILAEVVAYSAVVEGHVTGNVHTAQQLEISPDGIILGDVRTPSLVIRDGATLKGSVDMDASRPKPEAKQQEQVAPSDSKAPVAKGERQEREKVAVH